jgi:hypothetical protein
VTIYKTAVSCRKRRVAFVSAKSIDDAHILKEQPFAWRLGQTTNDASIECSR